MERDKVAFALPERISLTTSAADGVKGPDETKLHSGMLAAQLPNVFGPLLVGQAEGQTAEDRFADQAGKAIGGFLESPSIDAERDPDQR